MNKNYLALSFAVLALILPQGTHAAFNFSQVSQNGNGRAFTTTNSPAYFVGIGGNTLSHLAASKTDYKGMCDIAVQDSGLSDSKDTYCVFDAVASKFVGPAGGFTNGGGTAPTTCHDTNSCPAYPLGTGTWAPPSTGPYGANDDGSISYITISIYQTPFQNRDLNTVYKAMNDYNGNASDQAMCAMLAQYGLSCGGWTPAPDPGYDDVCSSAHRDARGANPMLYDDAGNTPYNACTIYYHDGVVVTKPVALLTATPSSVVSGGSSNLTYSCSNGATSASINGGVGSVSPASSGSRSVTPGSTTTYTLTCSNSAGSSMATASVAVIPTLSASCTVSPTSITAGQSATWTASASGGDGSYTYSWSGTDGLNDSGASVSSVYSSAGTKTASVTVSSGLQSQTFACGNALTVGAAPAADLTSGSVSASGAVAGRSATLSAPDTNIGNGSSGGFPTLFQIADSAISYTIAYRESGYISLTPSESYTVSTSYTFGSSGTYYVRACANNNSSWTNITSESNYANNCGPWTAVTVGAPPAPTCSLSAAAPTVPTTVSWSSTNATSCTGAGFSTGGATTGSTGVSDAGVYQISCSGDGGTCTMAVSVAANTCAGPATPSIMASPTRVRPGQTSTIRWNASNIPGNSPSCTISGPGVSQTVAAGGAPTCAIPAGSATPTILTQSTYTITCGGVSQSATVNVVPKF